jgi:hypothetical protein
MENIMDFETKVENGVVYIEYDNLRGILAENDYGKKYVIWGSGYAPVDHVEFDEYLNDLYNGLGD